MKSVLITSSILIMLLAALRPLLRGRVDPRAQYALWLLAALRLLLPAELAPSAYSALALLERAEEPSRMVEAIGRATLPLPGVSYEEAYDRALREYEQNRPAISGFTDLDEVELRARELQAQSPTLAELAGKYARPVWLGGAAVMALWFLYVNLRLRRRLKGAAPVEADCPLPVYLSGALPSPCLRGGLRPAIYVTPAALESPERLRHVLAHELTHYRHRDHWWALVRCLCLCLYWFDPLVWWAAAMSRQDGELACDAGAIRRLGEEERIPYGRTLVGMIAAGRTSLLQTATTMTGGRRRVKERVKLIARKPKTVLALALAAALLLGCAVGCTFTGAPESSPDPSPLSSDALNTATLPSRLLDVPEDLQGSVEASAPQRTIQDVVDRLLAAPSVELSLAPAGTSRIYAYVIDPSQDPNDSYLSALASHFRWEAAPCSTSEGADTLRVSALDGSASLLLSEGSYLVLDGDGNCWKGVYSVDDYAASADTTPFDYLRRMLFDIVELAALRTTSVPDRGQSHEEAAREWAENWEGAYAKTAPGSQYARTYVRVENINAGAHSFMEEEAMDEFARSRDLVGADYGKIWFTFSYDTVFVPVDQSEDGPVWAGNTRYYEGDGAPEGALVYSHVGYMFHTGEGWRCKGVGTGW